MECKVPRSKPRVLPLVRHRDDIGVVQVLPIAVASLLATSWRWRSRRVTVEPVRNYIVVELLRPDQTGEGLPHHVLSVGAQVLRNDLGVELIRLGLAPRKRFVKLGISNSGAGSRVGQPQPDRDTASSGYIQQVDCGGFRAGGCGIHRVLT